MTAQREFVVGDVLPLPSGSARDRGKPHDHILVAGNDTDVLIVPICTLRRSHKDVELVLTGDELDWLEQPSFPLLTRARLVPRANLRNLISSATRQTKANAKGLLEATASSKKVAATVGRLIYTSDNVADRLKRFIAEVGPVPPR